VPISRADYSGLLSDMIRKLLRPTPAERPDTDEILAMPQIRAKVWLLGARLEMVSSSKAFSLSCNGWTSRLFKIQTGEEMCQGRHWDGMVVLSTPDEYKVFTAKINDLWRKVERHEGRNSSGAPSGFLCALHLPRL
jgi:hypothetical protein